MRYIDLFAGAGGFSEGFKRAGFEPVAHVEVDKSACLTLKTRVAYHYLKSRGKKDLYLQYLRGEITRPELYSEIPSYILDTVINLSIGDEHNEEIFRRIGELNDGEDIDIIIGGPPCQAYSIVGRARAGDGMLGDPRNYLYVQYGRFLCRFEPKMFVFENVLGLLSAGKGKHLKNIQRYFERIGYVVQPIVVNALDFGVLQHRRRVLILGWKKGLDLSIGELSRRDPLKHMVKSIFSGLPKLSAGEGIDKYLKYTVGRPDNYLRWAKIKDEFNILTQHMTRPQTKQDKEIYRITVQKWERSRERLNYNDLPDNLKTHKNRDSFLDRFKVVAADMPYSHTVVAHIAKDGHYYIHPDIEQNRSLSVREAARLQTFPDDYYFESAKSGHIRTPAYRQIGNAVPPLMVEKIARKIAHYLRR